MTSFEVRLIYNVFSFYTYSFTNKCIISIYCSLYGRSFEYNVCADFMMLRLRGSIVGVSWEYRGSLSWEYRGSIVSRPTRS